MAQDDVEPVVDGDAPGLAAELLGQQRERVEPARVALVAAAQLLDLALQLGQRAAGDALALALQADHRHERARVGLGGQPEERRARDLARVAAPRRVLGLGRAARGGEELLQRQHAGRVVEGRQRRRELLAGARRARQWRAAAPLTNSTRSGAGPESAATGTGACSTSAAKMCDARCAGASS